MEIYGCLLMSEWLIIPLMFQKHILNPVQVWAPRHRTYKSFGSQLRIFAKLGF